MFTYKVKVYAESDSEMSEDLGEFQAEWNVVGANPWSCQSSDLFNSKGGDWDPDSAGTPGDLHMEACEQIDGAKRSVFTLRRTKGPANASFFSTGAEGKGWQQKAGGKFPVLDDLGGGISFLWKVVG